MATPELPYVNALARERGTFLFREDPLADKTLLKGAAVDSWLLSNLAGKIRKTGTTICGAIYNGGVVLASDTRATMGPLVCIRNIQKLQWITPNIWCAGAGSAAELTHIFRQMRADMKLFEYNAGVARVETVVARLTQKLWKYQGYIKLAPIIGGVNPTGECHLCLLTPDGFRRSFPYVTMGSGCYFAQSILEAGYKDDMTKEEAIELCADAIEAGITHDEGSGSNVDVVVIQCSEPRQPRLMRSYRQPVAHLAHPQGQLQMPPEASNVVVTKEIRRPILPYSNDLPLNVDL